MKRAPRFPSRWAGLRTLAIPAALSAALGACATLDNIMYPAKEGTVEYPGSAYAPDRNAPASYVVKYKDTVDSVAGRFGVSPQVIIDANKLQQPYALVPGRTISIPGARVVAPTSSEPTTATAPTPPGGVKKEQLEPPPQGEPPQSAAPGSAPPGQREPVPLGPTASAAPKADTPPPRFEWPVHGKVVAGYGPRSDGQKNDGIEIAAEKDATVHAADGGTVVYAGNEVRGMGNLLLISHPGGYITAYGYNDALLVKKGDTVKKGQPVAKVGTSGAASDPRLHFEVRRGNKTVDPASMLPAQ
jgi:murein DD-endopeptidase MepM/ murein hydrolase activator NlpD